MSAAEYAGMMEQVALTIDSELRKDAGLPPINLTTMCIHSRPITEECPECMARWAGKAAYLSKICVKCGKNRANHASRDNEYWCVGNVNELFDDGIEGESREEFERDRMGQTGEDNALRMREKSAEIAARSHVLSSADPKPRIVDTAAEAAQVAVSMKKPPAGKKPAKGKRACTFCGKPLEPWSATTMRCTGCGRNEAV